MSFFLKLFSEWFFLKEMLVEHEGSKSQSLIIWLSCFVKEAMDDPMEKQCSFHWFEGLLHTQDLPLLHLI